MNKLTKRKLVNLVAVKNSIEPEVAEKVINSMLELMKESFTRMEPVMLWEFGRFIPKKVDARTIVGLGKEYPMGDRVKIKFSLSTKLKEQLNGTAQDDKKAAAEAFRAAIADDE